MTNEAFMLLSESERHTKFKAVLKDRTEGCLSAGKLRVIMLTLPPDRQYEVIVYRNSQKFCEALILPDGCRGRTVRGQVMAGHGQTPGMLFCETRAAAVLVKNLADEGVPDRLHIFIPSQQLQKG